MAGASVREYKRRIKSVQNTQQITKAMKMVAAAKLRRSQERAESSRPYTETLQETMVSLAALATKVEHPLLVVREKVKKVAYVLITADRGLCGAYNTNLIRMANETISHDQRDVESHIIAVGRKGRDFYRKRQGVAAEFVSLGDNISYAQAKEIADYIMFAYEQGVYDEVYLIYAKFINALRQEPTLVKVLPVDTPKQEKANEERAIEFIYEPSASEILAGLIPRYVGSQVYHALLEGKASELGATMTAMGNATENASEIISQLSLEMNKVRQSSITNEILDIVSGAEALNKGGR